MGRKHKRFREFWTPFLLRVIRKNPRSMCARVLQAMAQFVLKIEKLSHIMGPTPILEMARAYGLRPRLWLLTLPWWDGDSETCLGGMWNLNREVSSISTRNTLVFQEWRCFFSIPGTATYIPLQQLDTSIQIPHLSHRTPTTPPNQDKPYRF